MTEQGEPENVKEAWRAFTKTPRCQRFGFPDLAGRRILRFESCKARANRVFEGSLADLLDGTICRISVPIPGTSDKAFAGPLLPSLRRRATWCHMKSRKRPSWLSSEVGIDPGPPRNLAPDGARTLAVVLGSGGVTPNPHRNGPSAAIIANNTTYLIDAGEGIWRGLAWAAVSHPELIGEALAPSKLTRLFLTHLHSDHTIGMPAVWLMPWTAGREEPLTVYGPEGTSDLLEHLDHAYQADLNERRFGPQANPREPSWISHEIEGSGLVHQDENVKVEAFHHRHGSFRQNFAYRFTTAERVIAWAGDGRVEGHLDDAARDADVFFCELSTEDLIGSAPWGGSTLEEKEKTIWSYHIKPKELADFATKMNVKQLVTMHERNYTDPYVPNALMDEFKRDYAGSVYSARDGDVF